MGQMTEAEMGDGVAIRVYPAEPQGTPRAGIVIMHEAFGMNDHIRSVSDRYAGEGYLALAPALYDRAEKGAEVPGYDDPDLERGRALRQAVEWDHAIADMGTVVGLAREAGPVGVVGFCWGGSLAWLAVTRCGADAAVSYYGGQIIQFVDERPGCPVMAHFAEHDIHVPPESAAKVAEHHPDIPVFMYDAKHGFNCDARADYDAASAAVAQARTLEFLATNLGAAGGG